MNDRLLHLYHRLPPPARSIMATLRGAYLHSWRYGPETEAARAAALAHEHWSADEWCTFQTARLSYVLDRAARLVPYYREYWATRGEGREHLANWPILEKETLRQNPRAFIADDCDPRAMFHEQTSGTTGKPIELWRRRSTIQAWYGLTEARWREWYGVSRRDRWAILGGQLIAPVEQRRPPFWVWNAALKQLYLSAYHLAPDLMPHYLDALRKYRVRYLWGYSSALYSLAQAVLRAGTDDLKMAVAITNAEPLFESQRATIAQAFGCPVRETYGMAEFVAAAGECDAGRLHLWPEVGHVEVLNGDDPVAPGTVGDLVCTSLLDADMPLVRYRIGDQGSRLDDADCCCGRTLPILGSLEGRTEDVLISPDGRHVGRLDPVFKAELPIEEAQIIQDAPDFVRVRFVAGPGYTPDAGRSIVQRVRDRMGDVRVSLEPVDRIPRGANGKFRAVISHVSGDDRRQRQVLTGSGIA